MSGVKPMKTIAETQAGNRLTDDFVYFERMQELSVFQEPGNILSLAFSPNEPYFLAPTSSMRLGVFDTVHCEVFSMFTRFKSLVHGATFRKDGGLLGVETHEGFAQSYDVSKISGTSRKSIR
uniref:Uncharacterized protein n=1 Tax=Panagrolaimus davidi TaxID=227884 RepID=A0A914PGL4_9BILA